MQQLGTWWSGFGSRKEPNEGDVKTSLKSGPTYFYCIYLDGEWRNLNRSSALNKTIHDYNTSPDRADRYPRGLGSFWIEAEDVIQEHDEPRFRIHGIGPKNKENQEPKTTIRKKVIPMEAYLAIPNFGVF